MQHECRDVRIIPCKCHTQTIAPRGPTWCCHDQLSGHAGNRPSIVRVISSLALFTTFHIVFWNYIFESLIHKRETFPSVEDFLRFSALIKMARPEIIRERDSFWPNLNFSKGRVCVFKGCERIIAAVWRVVIFVILFLFGGIFPAFDWLRWTSVFFGQNVRYPPPPSMTNMEWQHHLFLFKSCIHSLAVVKPLSVLYIRTTHKMQITFYWNCIKWRWFPLFNSESSGSIDRCSFYITENSSSSSHVYSTF